mmetsp:Transcript_120880/g.189615  ORF Transcript_120880/g.189615 Transcript_120880/m.189615 type:complete len:138 (+) Transcript_120880:52-465(+)
MPCRSTAVTIVSCLNMLWYMCSAMRIDTEVASSLITARSGEDSAAILENATAEESLALMTPAQILCRDLPRLSQQGLRAMSDKFNGWRIQQISCREEKKNYGAFGIEVSLQCDDAEFLWLYALFLVRGKQRVYGITY